ncbi:GNAT family N-acetyltransferase [Lederbergia graminis]|uniref:GNAT family N-acetyltransferase n=1 Tax=Lederbergia graminis TaxID=735518 RepID=A0ABW0LMN9_9BACI
MVEYRGARRDEREDLLDLANIAFGFDFEPVMSKVYGEEFDSTAITKVAVDEKNRIRAQVAVLSQELNVLDFTLQAGYLGTVSVHPRSRGEGHMKTLMQMWLEELQGTHDLIVLSGQRQRYEYFGFTIGGVKVKYSVNNSNVRHALKEIPIDGITFKPLFEVEGAPSFVVKVNSERAAYVVRDQDNLQRILATFHEVALGVMKEDKLIGYVLTNKKGNEISEFACVNKEDILKVVKAYIQYADVEWVHITTPEYDLDLNASLGRFAENYVIETCDMYNILNFANVLEAYLTIKYKTTGLAQGEFSAILDGQPVTARVDENGVTVERSAQQGALELNKQEAQTLLLTPHGRYLEIDAPHGWFPLPAYWYKVDKF